MQPMGRVPVPTIWMRKGSNWRRGTMLLQTHFCGCYSGMSRAAFHRKFKRATTLAPIQFVKSMRLNRAAMKIAVGVSVSEAALSVGYVSTSQFSREFKRMYGQSPRHWGDAQHLALGAD